MNRKPIYKSLLVLLIAVLLSSNFAAIVPISDSTTVHAAGPGPNLILGLFRTIGAINRRNRIYREAGATAKEINAYYDGLITKTQEMRRDMISQAAAGETSPVLVRSYVRIEAALEKERDAAIQMIEAEKNQARLDFNRALVKEITGILIASPGGQKILNDVRNTITKIREAAVAVQVAANQGKPLDLLTNALTEQVSDIYIVQNAAYELGSAIGDKLDQALGGVLSNVQTAMNDIQGEMGSAIDLLDALDATVAQYQDTDREPISMIENENQIKNASPIDRVNAAVDVVAYAHAGAAELSGQTGGKTREDMRDRIREALLNQRQDEIKEIKLENMAGKTYCTGVGRGEYEVAVSQLGKEPEIPNNPENAVYLVCYQLGSHTPIYANMTEPDGKKEEKPTPTPEEEAPPEEVDLSELAGTYVGTTNFVNGYYDSWGGSGTTVTENEMVITISENGTVEGRFVVAAESPIKSNESCEWQSFYTEEGVISGQITEPTGTVTIDSTAEMLLVRNCLGGNSTSEYSFNYEFTIDISGDTLEGSWMDKTFEATKQ
jgi:hypothetical protein